MADLALSRRATLMAGLRYRRQQGMVNWVLHRLTGLGILLFVGLHVLAGFFGQQLASGAAYAVNRVYESWQFQVFIYCCVLYHVLNGARLAAMDLFPPLVRFHRELTWLQWAVFVPLYGLPAFLIIRGGLRAG
jgi:succinate dehydrogenase / fumarate reductase, cytochrome b subunit